ncbi:ribosome maturation factor RimP [Paraperlucidibaca baekdonensis]|uniref:Ribosome maturation factor RimP n=1 Tax=Paraperlucidibaca baekdonensis TaxID=748120 RepID=A0A3E0H9I8_9GAMM|nr:ribosome maturation factor RimP [Paraperlucidibaca baekdonensis]
MAISKKIEELTQLLAPVVESCDFQLWGVEFFQQGKHSVLRVYIDTDREAGVGIDDCSRVSHQVSGVMDVEDPIAGEYTLEVSSPGWDRALFNPSQYPAYVGEELNVRLTAPLQGRRRFKGVMLSSTDSTVTLQVDGIAYEIPFVSIDKSNIVPNF